MLIHLRPVLSIGWFTRPSGRCILSFAPPLCGLCTPHRFQHLEHFRRGAATVYFSATRQLQSLRAGSKAHHLLLAAWLSAMNLGRSDLVALAVTPPIRLPTLCFARQLIGRLVRLRQNVIRLILRGLEREHDAWIIAVRSMMASRTIRRIILSCGKSWRKNRAEAQSRDIDSVSRNLHFIAPLVSRHSQMVAGSRTKNMGQFFDFARRRCGQTNCVGPECLTEVAQGKHATLLFDGAGGRSWSGLIRRAKKSRFCYCSRRLASGTELARARVAVHARNSTAEPLEPKEDIFRRCYAGNKPIAQSWRMCPSGG